MNIAITGGAGYIGTSLIPLLLDRGHHVTVLDALDKGSEILLPHFSTPGFSIIRGDIRDKGMVKEAITDSEAVIHLAALSGYDACRDNPQEAQGVNVEGTRNVVKAAEGRFLIFASTCSGYGAQEKGVICTEDTPLHPVSLYGTTKVEGEQIVLDYAESLVFRFATGYGLSPMMRFNLLVNSFVDQLIRTGKLSVYEKEARRPYLHVQDMARAILHALENRNTFTEKIYNIGDDKQNLTKEEVCGTITLNLPHVTITWDEEGKDPDKRNYQVSFQRLEQTGFVPETDFSRGVEALVMDMVSL